MPTRASLSGVFGKSIVIILLGLVTIYTTIRLTNLVKLLCESPPASTIALTEKSTSVIPGHWHDLLVKIGIKPFDDVLQPDALRYSRPEADLRFDLRKRKRAFSLPTKTNLFFEDRPPHQSMTLAQQRRVLEKELVVFKKISEEHRRAELIKQRLQKKQTNRP
jgi:hypothetical protein